MQIDIPSDFVKAKQNIYQDDIVQLQDEGEWGTITDSRSGKDKKILRFQMKLASGEIKTYTMNKTTMKIIRKEYSTDSKEWVGKDLKAHVVTQMAFGKMTPVLVLTPPHWLTPTEGDEVEQPKETKKVEPKDVKKEDIPVIDK